MSKSVKMSRRRQRGSNLGMRGNGSKGSSGSDNLHVSMSMSPSSFPKTVGRDPISRNEKSRSVPTKPAKRTPFIAQARPRSDAVTSGIPEDVAVHFGKFYVHGAISARGERGRDTGTTKSEFPASEAPRSEFTRQMVHELERLAGTEYYARQVSALLDSTVESPNFDVKPPPADNFVPYQSSEPSDYPLWYKEPDKMLSLIDVDSTSHRNQTRKPSDECSTVGNSLRTIASGIRRSADVTDCENNDESSSASSSELASVSDAHTEEDSDYDEVKVAIIVK